MKIKSIFVIVFVANLCFLVAGETIAKTKKPIVVVRGPPRPKRNLPTHLDKEDTPGDPDNGEKKPEQNDGGEGENDPPKDDKKDKEPPGEPGNGKKKPEQNDDGEGGKDHPEDDKGDKEPPGEPGNGKKKPEQNDDGEGGKDHPEDDKGDKEPPGEPGNGKKKPEQNDDGEGGKDPPKDDKEDKDPPGHPDDGKKTPEQHDDDGEGVTDLDCSKHKNAKDGCPKIYAPVCGTDGKTYGNECMLCAEILSGKKIDLAYKGQCIDCSKYPQPPKGTPADCPMDHSPVCDAHGNTHAHICILCARIHTTGVKIGIIHEGECT